MTFPVTVGPGETGFLANPDQQKYFFWQGKKTSAQYYVNKQGVPEDEACTWGTEMGGKGNWAPAVFGTSFDDGPMQEGFSSLKQNELCKKERLGYDITFIGDGVVSPCRYKSATNQWCQADKCWEDPDRGCTVCCSTVLPQSQAIANSNRLLSCMAISRLYYQMASSSVLSPALNACTPLSCHFPWSVSIRSSALTTLFLLFPTSTSAYFSRLMYSWSILSQCRRPGGLRQRSRRSFWRRFRIS